MHYTYTDQGVRANHPWIKAIYDVSDLEDTYAGSFTEVHVTVPKLPGDKDNWPTLMHITVVTTKAYRYHWYVLGGKISDKRRIEEIGKNKSKNDIVSSSEKVIVDYVIADIREKGW